ncbi:hypothetical protein F4777DRAFT_571893 [Nemania sp. FL0916]|nr:hypothetical protein F4777DRAFT_571893 [Nemania sp. FL0916]
MASTEPVEMHSAGTQATGASGVKPTLAQLGTTMPPRDDCEFFEVDANLGFRWFHVSVNDTHKIEECVRKIIEDDQRFEKIKQQLLLRRQLRPTIARGSSNYESQFVYSRFLEPSCGYWNPSNTNPDPIGLDRATRPSESPSAVHLFLFLPYMTWAKVSDLQILRKLQTDLAKPSTFHYSRTIDEFYYTGLQNKTTRDYGQTVSKWTGDHRPEDGWDKAVDSSDIIMVDQLWLWVLNDGTLITSFPLSYTPSGESSTSTGELSRSPISNRDICTAAMLKKFPAIRNNLERFTSAYFVAVFLVKELTAGIFREKVEESQDLLGTYRWAIGRKASKQTRLFEVFGDMTSGVDSSTFASNWSSIAQELHLVLDVANILDELNIIGHLIERQRAILTSLRDIFLSLGSDYELVHINALNTGQTLIGLSDTVMRLKADTENIHKMLLSLLDLKQKAASLYEARSATKQGNVILLFTIVTIIFAPLSIFASLYSQVPDVWTYGGGISAAVIIISLFAAWLIIFPKYRKRIITKLGHEPVPTGIDAEQAL